MQLARLWRQAAKRIMDMAWYRFLYAPRAGGAYGSHHRTAGIAGRTRRRGRVAGRGAGAAAGDAGDRVPLVGATQQRERNGLAICIFLSAQRA